MKQTDSIPDSIEEILNDVEEGLFPSVGTLSHRFCNLPNIGLSPVHYSTQDPSMLGWTGSRGTKMSRPTTENQKIQSVLPNLNPYQRFYGFPSSKTSQVLQRDQGVRSHNRTKWKERRDAKRNYVGFTRRSLLEPCVNFTICDEKHLDMVWLKTLGEIVHNRDKPGMSVVYHGASVHQRLLVSSQPEVARRYEPGHQAGFCTEGNQRLLVFEYMCNGSLDIHLQVNKGTNLDWSSHLIKEIVTIGLWYFHEDCRVGWIVHIDMQQPKNIPLTQVMNLWVLTLGSSACSLNKIHTMELLELITCIRIIELQGYKAHEFWHDICASQEMDLVHLLADKYKLLKKEMRSFFEQVLLSEPKLSASDWRIPIIFLVSCSIIARWEQVDWWLSWWKGRLAEDVTGEEAWAIQIQFLETSLEDKTFWKAGVMI
ncbi:unnamed protein product [Lactuca virosa]|uniref:Protein kinase domain-containing protein n=1 Tax=Lactuca virosa TaxID=75947 RepID=A0AAU9PQ67_9ASTR|nr:unnamed protein product [Lactuca virosa]